MNAQNISKKSKSSLASRFFSRLKSRLFLVWFLFIQFEFNFRNVLNLDFNDWKAIWQLDFFWQFEIISTTVFCFLQHINISIVCFNDFHELVLKLICILHTITQSVQTLCKIVHLLIDWHCFFKMSVFFHLEIKFIDFCVSSFWHFSNNKVIKVSNSVFLNQAHLLLILNIQTD